MLIQLLSSGSFVGNHEEDGLWLRRAIAFWSR